MDDLFITEYFDWKIRRHSYIDRFLNHTLGKIGLNVGSPVLFYLIKLILFLNELRGERYRRYGQV